MLSKYDFEISIVAWLAAAAATYWVDPSPVIFVFATINLMVQRLIAHNAGQEFERKVRSTLAADLTKFEHRMAKVEADAKSVKDAQNSIASSLSKGPVFGRTA